MESKNYLKSLRHDMLNVILDGTKTVEGRVLKGDWKEMKFGDTITFCDGWRVIVKKIVAIKLFVSFADMYEVYGRSLLPDIDTKEKAELFYKDIYDYYLYQPVAFELGEP